MSLGQGLLLHDKFREEIKREDELAVKKKAATEESYNMSHGYGGKFGVMEDRMDKTAMGHDFIGKVDKHNSQKDYKSGFGGKFGVDKDRQDKSAVGWDHVEKVEKHTRRKTLRTDLGVSLVCRQTGLTSRL